MKIFTAEFSKYVNKCIFSSEGSKNPKAISTFMAYVSQQFLWEVSDVFWRQANRHLYEGSTTITTQWTSLGAKELLKNGIAPTADHPYCPSSCYASYIYAFWEVYNDFFEFFKIWKIMSQTIWVTSLENDLLSCFTFSIDGRVKVSCPLDQRYLLLNIICQKDGEFTSIDFPLEICSNYLSYEKDNLLDEALMSKTIKRMKSKLEKAKKDTRNIGRPIILEQIETLTLIVNNL